MVFLNLLRPMSMSSTKRFRSFPIWVLLMLLAAGTVSASNRVRCLTEPVDDVLMSSIVEGAVSAIHFGEGDFVEKETVVLELDSVSEQLDIQRREVLVETLKATMERSEKLLASTSSISMEEVDASRTDYRIAVLELELAKNALDKKRLKAPFSGTITDLPIEVGEYTEPPQALLRLVDTRQFYCVANVDPVEAAALKINHYVTYTAESRPDMEPMSGKIVFISPVVDSASGLLRIKALFSNSMGVVRPGEGGFLNLSPKR